MGVLKIRKNFIFDKDIVEKTRIILDGQEKNFTEIINLYFKAIIKDPSILKTTEQIANKRTGAFIGVLDGKIGDDDFKLMKEQHHENIS
jgi:hypothetical protein